MKNQQLSPASLATVTGPRPGAFAVGSPQSRAAARALLEAKIGDAERVDLVAESDHVTAPQIGAWEANSNGSYTRRSSIPSGMSFDQALAIAGHPPRSGNGDYTCLIIG